MKNLYKATNLSKEIGSEKILKNFNAEFSQGVNVIVGPSGAGKSTLLNLLGIIDDISQGNISYNGEDINSYTGKKRSYFEEKKLVLYFNQET